MMGAVNYAYIEIMTRELCGSCRFYLGNRATGNLTGSCPVDGPNAGAQNNPCTSYKSKQRGINAN